jgi:cation diffusion facilitator CzcD-associated flavoprotein CzcO
VPQGTVLVVGGGNTGYQIAKELSATHEVHLAVGSRQKPLPQRQLGRDLFWRLTKTGLIEKDRRLQDRKNVLRRRGATEVPGLYFLGLSWQHTRGSALIGWVEDDADFIAGQTEAFRSERAANRDGCEIQDVGSAAGALVG